MPAPILAVSSKLLAQAVFAKTPRFAAALMRADFAGQPIEVESRFSMKNMTMQNMLTRVSPVISWAHQVGLGMAGTALGPAGVLASHAVGQTLQGTDAKDDSVTGKLKGIYSRFIQSDDAPAAPTIAPRPASAVAAKEEAPELRQQQLLLLAAAVKDVGYGGVLAGVNADSFGLHIADQVKKAADVVAPTKLVSQMSQDEIRAIAASALQGSNQQFIKLVQGANPAQFASDVASRSIVKEAGNGIDAGEFAKKLMQGNSVSPETLADIAGGASGHAGTLMKSVMQKSSMISVGVAAALQDGGKNSFASAFANPVKKLQQMLVQREAMADKPNALIAAPSPSH